MLRAEANSILELLMLTAQQGTKLILQATGPDAETALDAMAELI
jgi:phosphotransferase system HPr (HPr) family protein